MVHFARNALALAPKGMQAMVAAAIRTSFAQPTPEATRAQWRQVADGFAVRYPKVAELMDTAEADVLAYLAFLRVHRRQIWSTNPLEWVILAAAPPVPPQTARATRWPLLHT
jgi:transposase-like protein